MLSSAATKASPLSYVRTTRSMSGFSPNWLSGVGGDGLLYGFNSGTTPVRVDPSTGVATVISSSTATPWDYGLTTVSTTNIMVWLQFSSPNFAVRAVGPYSGSLLAATQLFAVSSGGFSPQAIVLDETMTTVYIFYNNTTIASYTGWNGTTATKTVITTSINSNINRIGRSLDGTFYLTANGGKNLGSGSVVNYTMTPAGTITSMANSINITGAIAIDADGLPVIPGGSSGTAYLTKVGTSTSTTLNGSSLTGSTQNIAINLTTRVIYVLDGTTLYVYTPAY